MNIIIAGCGKVGGILAERLSHEKHDITVIDQKAEIVDYLTNVADVRGVVGNGASYSIQKEAGIEQADLLIAVTDADEVNLLCCLIAKKAGGCRTIARVRNPIYQQEIRYIKDELGLAMVINPEWTAALEMARILRFPSAIEIDTFAQGRIELLRFQLEEGNDILCGQQIKNIKALAKCQVLICIVERGNQVLIPDGNLKLQEGDTIGIVASPANASAFFRLIKIETNQVKNTMIIGGGTTSFYLANRLLDLGVKVKILEKDRRRCEELNALLPKATIVHGDGTDPEVLDEEGLRSAEGVVALTEIDEENVMLSLYAKEMSRAQRITRVKRDNYDTIIENLNIGNIIHVRHMAAEQILQYVRAMQNSVGIDVETLYRLVGEEAEALEIIIREESELTNVPLMKLELKSDLLVCAIYRNGKTIIPKGADSLKVGDSVVIITTKCGEIRGVQDLLKKAGKR